MAPDMEKNRLARQIKRLEISIADKEKQIDNSKGKNTTELYTALRELQEKLDVALENFHSIAQYDDESDQNNIESYSSPRP